MDVIDNVMKMKRKDLQESQRSNKASSKYVLLLIATSKVQTTINSEIVTFVKHSEISKRFYDILHVFGNDKNRGI